MAGKDDKLDLNNIKAGDPDDDTGDTGDRGDELESSDDGGDDNDSGADDAAAKAGGKAAKPAAKKASENGAADGKGDDAAGDGDGDDADGEDDEEAARVAALAARRETDDAPEVGGKGWVPPHRLREATAGRREAEAKVAQLQAQLAAVSGGKGAPDPVKELETTLDGLYEKVEEARAEGRTADAAKMQRQIDQTNRQISEISSTRVATQRALETAHATAYDATVEEIEAKFPELNPDNEKLFDPELAQEVLDLAAGFQHAKKLSPKAALLRALTYVFKEEYLETGTVALYAKTKKGAAAETTPEGKDAGTKRKAEAVQRNLKASGRQPPVLSDAGKSDSKADQMSAKDYSDEDWEKLPESTKARLRGDFVGA